MEGPPPLPCRKWVARKPHSEGNSRRVVARQLKLGTWVCGMDRPKYRIFVSSPSDVRPERLIAERVITKLARELHHHCDVEAVLWEREPLVAGHHFQDYRNIPPPRTTDICVVVLWSRLGVTLPVEEFTGALSGKAVTGTEWEFEDALASYRARGLPALLLYQKRAAPMADLSDAAVVLERLDQKKRVTDFLNRWLKSADGASFTAASHAFSATAQFEEQLEDHLRALLRRRLDQDLGAGTEIGAITWAQAPWRGLEAFETGQAAIFFGRTRARNEAREMLAAQARAGKAFLLVLGASGSGKSSLVKAGLLPDIMLPGMIGRVALVRHASFQPSSGEKGPVSALADAVLRALPELTGLQYTSERLVGQLRANPAQVSFAVEQGLAQAAQGKLTSAGEARLVLVVDQLEELFTLERATEENRKIFVAALDALARSGRVWVVATFRSDFFDRLESLTELAALSDGGRYLLAPPTIAELGQIIRRPAQAAGLRFEVDAATGEGLDDVILKAATADPGALPLLSFALDQLWRRRDPDKGVLTLAAYAAMDGFEGAIGHRAEEVFLALPPPVQAAFPSVLMALVTVGMGPTAESTALAAPALTFTPGTPSAALVKALLEPDARLLVADGEGVKSNIRIAHEALLNAWPRAKDEIARQWEDLQRRARVGAAAGLWLGEGRPAARLLPAGLPLTEAEDLVARFPQVGADSHIAEFVRASARRQTSRRALLAFGLPAIAGGMAAGAWGAKSLYDRYDEKRRTTTVDFAGVDIPGPDYRVAAASYLGRFGVSIAQPLPSQAQVSIWNNRGLYGGQAVLPTTSDNFLSESADPVTAPMSYTLNFEKAAISVRLVRAGIFAATASGVSHPAWYALALNHEHRPIAVVSEPIIRSFGSVTAKPFDLQAPGSQLISGVQIVSDCRLNAPVPFVLGGENHPGPNFAGFQAVLISQIELVR
jgi:hypothetical protein